MGMAHADNTSYRDKKNGSGRQMVFVRRRESFLMP